MRIASASLEQTDLKVTIKAQGHCLESRQELQALNPTIQREEKRVVSFPEEHKEGSSEGSCVGRRRPRTGIQVRLKKKVGAMEGQSTPGYTVGAAVTQGQLLCLQA